MILYSILFWGIFWLLGFFRWGSLFWIYSLFWSAMSALVFHLVDPLVGVWILYFAGIFLFLFFALRRRRWGKLCLGVLLTVATVLVIALPFTQGFNFLWLLERYRATLDYYSF